MSFSSLVYPIFLFAVFAAYWGLRRRQWQNLLLVVASYTFYAWWDYRFLTLLLVSTAVDFSVGLGLSRTAKPRARRLLVFASVTVNLAILGVFKYFNFFIDNFQTLATSVGWSVDLPTLQILLPIGISFYTFQTISYSIDVYRGRIKATHNAIDFLAYVAFFPQLVAGPIERAHRLLPQLQQDRRFDPQLATEGIQQILWGLFKKIVIADNLALIVDPAFADPGSASGPALLLATFSFMFQLYYDFSAYSDIAIGSARLLGIRLTRNFD